MAYSSADTATFQAQWKLCVPPAVIFKNTSSCQQTIYLFLLFIIIKRYYFPNNRRRCVSVIEREILSVTKFQLSNG
jgi:hypothetical protein